MDHVGESKGGRQGLQRRIGYWSRKNAWESVVISVKGKQRNCLQSKGLRGCWPPPGTRTTRVRTIESPERVSVKGATTCTALSSRRNRNGSISVRFEIIAHHDLSATAKRTRGGRPSRVPVTESYGERVGLLPVPQVLRSEPSSISRVPPETRFVCGNQNWFNGLPLSFADWM